MSEDSDWEEAEPLAQRAKVTRKNDILTINRPRSLAQLQQYGRFFSDDADDAAATAASVGDQDGDHPAWNDVPSEWDRSQIYEYFARQTRCIRPFRIIAYPDWINAQATGPNEELYVKDRNVCRCCHLFTYAFNKQRNS